MSESLAIRIKDVTKLYKLYGCQRDQFVDTLGLTRFGFRLRHPVKDFTALNDISLDVPRGQRIGIVGRNGAGKTTLLKLISGNFAPTTGDVAVNGKLQALMSAGLGFHPEFTGRENIHASLQYNDLTPAEYQEAVDDVIAFCELGDFLDQPFKSYSLGMQSRLQFACATSIRPDILIVDEVLGAGDVYFSVKSSARMERLARSGATLVLVSHSMQQVLQFCERVIWIDGGKIVRDGDARAVVGEYEVFMETKAAPLLAESASSAPDREGASYRLARSAELDEAGDGHADGKRFDSRLEDGQKVFRWPSEKGAKLSSFKIRSNGVETRKIKEGDQAEFLFTVTCEVEGDWAFRYQITIFSIDNRIATRVLSEVDRFTCQPGMKRQCKVVFDPLLLGASEYYINFVVLDEDPMKAGAPTKRYDLVARFGDFEVVSYLDYRESAVFSHPASWEFGD